MPVLTLIAVPNGSGKSTIAKSLEFDGKEYLLDPDRIATRMRPDAPQLAALAAGREVLNRAREYIHKGQTFALETTLSGKRTLAMIRMAKARGFAVEMVYICVDSAEHSVLRVRDRVAKGGHDVPDEDVRRRYKRSLRNLPEALRMADKAVAYDNSDVEPRKVLEARRGVMTWRSSNEPGWAALVCREIGDLGIY